MKRVAVGNVNIFDDKEGNNIIRKEEINREIKRSTARGIILVAARNWCIVILPFLRRAHAHQALRGRIDACHSNNQSHRPKKPSTRTSAENNGAPIYIASLILSLAPSAK